MRFPNGQVGSRSDRLAPQRGSTGDNLREGDDEGPPQQDECAEDQGNHGANVTAGGEQL